MALETEEEATDKEHRWLLGEKRAKKQIIPLKRLQEECSLTSLGLQTFDL